MRDPVEKEKLMRSGDGSSHQKNPLITFLDNTLRNYETQYEEERVEDIEEDDDQREIERIRKKQRNLRNLTGAEDGHYEELR